ncbi:uncharacterized protein N7498_006150 [Penicillium cinerascens]|uniref:Uncharacterized protein n=1 Tax=Penicillium cinerascens TaxID=70096 RepID=A0A9W9MI03_9EURO|nr:uncharacterized protein N7498_006150 [Penicillium cinerascens]KAJ5201487.1 hypothetical protein N7498_006150 [Penicillium cinerascens]
MDGHGADSHLASILLPYLEEFDESAINHLATQLKGYGISVDAVTASERSPSFRLVFSKESSSVDHIDQASRIEILDFWASQSANTEPMINRIDFNPADTPDLAMLLDLQMGNGRRAEQNYDYENGDTIEGVPQDFCQQTRPPAAQPTSSHWPECELASALGLVVDGSNPISPETQGELSEASSGLACQPSDFAIHSNPQEQMPYDHNSPRRRPVQVSKNRSRTSASSDAFFECFDPLYTTSCSSDRAPTQLRSLFGPGTKYNLPDKILHEILEISENFIRPDLVEFLEESLPRWKTAGLWLQEQIPAPSTEGSGRTRLLNAYSCIFKLENRIRDDQILNRVAVATLYTTYEQAYLEWRHAGSQQCKGQGRGDASTVIDGILVELHPDWHLGDRKRHLRSRFHDKKRFGKRWLMLIRLLGESILISCSTQIASAVHTTVFTTGMLEALAYCIERTDPKHLCVLGILNSTAASLLRGGRCDDIDPDQILAEIRSSYTTS